ncbi:NAD(P)H-hydrate dehydratase [Bacteroidales bacterium OttesenSCG-928-M11]|nr:NAD(P)H-hydrate dehydratase [Bacteroidales bacterium OttesenSCG-928-M11]
MKVLSSSEIRLLDQYTIEHEPIASIDLMERASECFVERFVSEVLPDQNIYVLAGPGNNGGDALAITRMLIEKGYTIQCFLLNPNDKLSPDCQINKERLAGLISIRADLNLLHLANTNDIIIDGIFGSGLNKPTSGIFAKAINLANQSGAKIYSIDIPSGLFGEDNTQNKDASIIQASKTFTFASPKLAFLFPESGLYAGDWEVLDIGLSKEGMEKIGNTYHYTQEDDISLFVKKRNRFAYKNKFGHVLVIAGSKGKMGAAILCAKACLRSGAGLVTCHIPACGEVIMQSAFPEAMTISDKEEYYISQVEVNSSYNTLAIGPGLGTNEASKKALENILASYRRPIVLDADALNIISYNPELKKQIPPRSVLTPHIGELNRLVGESISSFERLEKSCKLAKELNCIVVLKGTYTAICTPGEQVYFNSSGNPGMATAGSGDVLTGIIAGLVAQGYESFEAALLGVYLHGAAGDKAASIRSEESMIASDIISYL